MKSVEQSFSLFRLADVLMLRPSIHYILVYVHFKYSTCLFSAAAMERLASCYHPRDIGSVAYKLYEDFRPGIPDGVQGWGAKGLLDLSKLSLLVAFVKQMCGDK